MYKYMIENAVADYDLFRRQSLCVLKRMENHAILADG